MTTIVTVDPATGRPLAEYVPHSRADLDAILDRAVTAHQLYAGWPLAARARLLLALAAELRTGRDRLAALVTAEMGKPLAEAYAEVDKCAFGCEWYAAQGPALLEPTEVDAPADRAFVTYEPLGVVLAVMPWNFPLWQVFRFLAPTLMAGNAALVKHAPISTGASLAVEALVTAAGGPDGLVTALLVAEADVAETTARLIADARVAAVTVTGSERAGAAVGAAAGSAVKRSVLELGGSDPFVVLADADVDLVASHAAAARFLNAGQSCISPKRMVVVADVADRFTDALTAAVSALPVGDPAKPGTRVGPLARDDLRDGVHRQVTASVAAGATLLAGGYPLDREGFYYAPTVLSGVRPGMPAYDEEVFGPVAAVIVATDDDDAVRIANDTAYGLGASVWGEPSHAQAVGARIRSGSLFVNAPVASDPRLPFGGTRRSGYGRELAGPGLLEFVNIRSWWRMDSPASAAAALSE